MREKAKGRKPVLGPVSPSSRKGGRGTVESEGFTRKCDLIFRRMLSSRVT